MLAIIMVILFKAGFTQSDKPVVLTQRQALYGYHLTANFGSRWYLQAEAVNVQFMLPRAENGFGFFAHLHYNFNENWNAAVGFAYCVLSTQNPYKKTNLYDPEVRPFGEAGHTINLGPVTLNDRFRFESRFLEKANQGGLTGQWFFSARFVHRMGIDIRLMESKDKKHIVKLRLTEEIMVNDGKTVTNVFDQNRAFAGINYQPPGPISFEAGYMHWYQQQLDGINFFNRHIIRFAIYQKVDWPVKKKKR
jgi:hypothetical protein